jgi:Fe-S oxidoreductase
MEMVKGYKYVSICPSIERYQFHAYSGGGRLNVALSLIQGRTQYSERLLHIIYNCQLCGGCDVSCKYAMDMEVLEPLLHFRIRAVEDGYVHPALQEAIEDLRKTGRMVRGKRADVGRWIEQFDLKDASKGSVEILYHFGCRTLYDERMWKVALAGINLFKKAGINVGVFREEVCCGGRACKMGFREESLAQARRFLEGLRISRAKILVTACAECYHAFSVLYVKLGVPLEARIVHLTEFLAGLLESKELRAKGTINKAVTYHDPCHLGRLGEPFGGWTGREIEGHIRLFDPPRVFRRGTYGVYDPPRKVLGMIPGLRLLEMPRRKEYAWCCGAGGGVKESNPDFALWTANRRIEEAISTGAEAIVTSCPGCELNFRDALSRSGIGLEVYDVAEILNDVV